MKLKNSHLYSVLGAVVVVLVAIAIAQEAPPKVSCPVSGVLSACGGCPSSNDTVGAMAPKSLMKPSGPAVRNLPVYLDGPGALLAQAETLNLTAVQKSKIQAILDEGRVKAVAVLTDAQLVSLGTVPSAPVIMGKSGVTAQGCTGGGCGSCPGSAAKSSDCGACPDKAAGAVCPATGAAAVKPCCTVGAVTQCGADCTKPCCAAK